MDWESFTQGAFADPAEAIGQSLLTTTCLMRQQIVDATKKRDGLPVGRPSEALGTHSAALLKEFGHTTEHRVIGRVLFGWGRPLEALDGDDADFERWVSELEETVRMARSTGDKCLVAWTQASASSRFRTRHRTREATKWAKHAQDTLTSISRDQRFPGPLAFASDHLPEQGDNAYNHFVTIAWCWKVLADSFRRAGDVHHWGDALHNMISASREVLAQRPSLLSLALNKKCTRDRVLGRTVDVHELEELARTSRAARTTLLVVQAANASHVGAYSKAIALHEERVSSLLQKHSYPDYASPDLVKLKRFLAALPEHERRGFNSIANGSYEIARALVFSGEAGVEPAAKRSAAQWLAVTEAIWEGWATNGVLAVRFLSSKLRLLEGGETSKAVNELLDISRRAPRAGLTVNAVYEAATLPSLDAETAGRTAQRLRNMLATAEWDPIDQGKLLAAQAWLQRTHPHSGHVDIRQTAEKALKQLDGRISRHGEHAVRAHWALAEISTEEMRIVHYRQALQGVCRLLLRATTPDICLIYARTWSPLIRASLMAGMSQNVHELVDMAAEVVRRDGLTVQLADAYLDERTSEEITQVIQQSFSAANADMSESDNPESKTEEPDEPEGVRSMRAQSEELIAAVQLDASAKARDVLGPLGLSLDPETLIGSTARKVVAAKGSDEHKAYILQYLPLGSELIQPGDTTGVFRRMTWSEPNGEIHELTDLVHLPAKVLREPAKGSSDFWTDGRKILPPKLISVLDATDSEHPIRLMVIATGLFHLLWDALQLNDNGTRLLERATVTVHTSLISAMPQRPRAGTVGPGSTAVFDRKLTHTVTERNALMQAFPQLNALTNMDELRLLQGNETLTAVFAMGVHGNDDQDGWGQYKILPTGELFTAADALNLRYPDLCVLASCHSQVRLMGGLDLAGFPSAMFARGARTVIGSVGAIPDKETAEILEVFYGLVSQGTPVPQAMRQAKLEWLEQSSASWRSPGAWARIVTYGSAHE